MTGSLVLLSVNDPLISERDKVFAAAVNVSAIFFPYAGPLVGAILGAKMPYVKYYAFKSLIEELVATLVIGFLLILSVLYSIWSVRHAFEGGFEWSKVNWIGIILKSVVTWLLLSLWGLVNIGLSVHHALRALRGYVPIKPKWTDRQAMSLAGMNTLMIP